MVTFPCSLKVDVTNCSLLSIAPHPLQHSLCGVRKKARSAMHFNVNGLLKLNEFQNTIAKKCIGSLQSCVILENAFQDCKAYSSTLLSQCCVLSSLCHTTFQCKSLLEPYSRMVLGFLALIPCRGRFLENLFPLHNLLLLSFSYFCYSSSQR